MRITYNDKLNKLLNPYLESLLKEKTSLRHVHGRFGYGRPIWYIQ